MQALRLATVEPTQQDCIVITLPLLPDGDVIHWPGLKSSKLFVRKIYVDFYESKLNEFKPRSGVDTLLRGVPGAFAPTGLFAPRSVPS